MPHNYLPVPGLVDMRQRLGAPESLQFARALPISNLPRKPRPNCCARSQSSVPRPHSNLVMPRKLAGAKTSGRLSTCILLTEISLTLVARPLLQHHFTCAFHIREVAFTELCASLCRCQTTWSGFSCRNCEGSSGRGGWRSPLYLGATGSQPCTCTACSSLGVNGRFQVL